MSDVRIFIESSSITRYQAAPVWDAVLERRLDEQYLFYREDFKSALRFGGASALSAVDYDNLNQIDKESCEVVTVEVEVLCGGVWSLRLRGEFTWLDVDHDQDKAIIRVRPRSLDDYTCFMAEIDRLLNIYSLPVIEVEPFSEAEELITDTNVNGPLSLSDPYLEVLPPDDANWCGEYVATQVWEVYDPAIGDPADGFYVRYVATTYQRLEADGTCSGGTAVAPTPDPYWTLLQNNCPTSSRWFRCPDGDESSYVRSKLKWGRDFNSVLEEIFSPCGLTVISDFFGINPDNTAPANDAYAFAEANLQKMTIHQKSDVKRPYASDPAKEKQWEFRRSDMLRDLHTIFNVYWSISGTEVRIEHLSYRDETGGFDASAYRMQLRTEASDGERVKEEQFGWMDAQVISDYFAGSPITYECGTEVIERRVSLFSTDINVIDTNDNNDVADDGFVLLACSEVGGVRSIIRDNRPLSWTELHDKLHRHYRRFVQGTINGAPATFLSTRGVRAQPPFTIFLPCDEVLDPTKRITTPIGAGQIVEAEENLVRNTVKVSVKY